ncbi:hypothetical protein [Enterocloster clostridioformis]|uniref:hypothetical protein n=1 Tax=Enterocloster clostridioformis TaxID=1531 RepID=UPI0004802420|nr:hypothetical protein [Enterocloster clostridioformis]
MGEKFRDFKHLRGGEEKANPKLTAYQVELAQVEAEIEKLLDTLTGANATLLAYANKKIEELDTRRQKIAKAIADYPLRPFPNSRLICCPAIWTTGRISALRIRGKPRTA